MEGYNGERQSPAPRDKLAEPWSPDLWQKEKINPDFVREPRDISRRSLLTGGIALAAVPVLVPDPIGMFAPPTKSSNEIIVGQFDGDPEVRRIHSHLKERYGIDLAVGPEKNQEKILGNIPSLEKYKVTLRLMKEEMFKYPPDMIHKIGEGRGFETRAIEGLSTKGEITGMYDAQGKEIAGFAPLLVPGKPAQLLVNPGQPGYFQRQTLHHDLNHRLVIKLEDPQERDRKWEALHKNVSQNPYRRVSPDTKATAPPEKRYFLTQYASSSAEEDQAVCAEWMMTPRLHAEFVRRKDTDPDPLVREILAAKYEQVIADYDKWSDGEMGRPFWEGVHRKGLEEEQKAKQKQKRG